MAIHAPSTPEARPSRRDLLSAAGFTGLAAVSTVGWVRPDTPAAAASPLPSRDARLIDLVAQYIRTDRQIDAISSPYYETPMDQIPEWVDEQSEHLVDELHRLRREIGDIDATTHEGIVAKARAALAAACIMPHEDLNDDRDDFIAHSLCRDLLRGVA